MEDREVLLRLIEDYPNLINSLEEGADIENWLKNFYKAIRSIYSENDDDVLENLRFLILYLFNKKGFFILLSEFKGWFYIRLCYTEEDPKSQEGLVIAFFSSYQSSHNNEQVLREKLLKNIIGNFKPSIPKEKEMLQEVIYNCEIVFEELKA